MVYCVFIFEPWCNIYAKNASKSGIGILELSESHTELSCYPSPEQKFFHYRAIPYGIVCCLVEDLPWICVDHMESVSLALSMKFDGLLDVCIHKQYVGRRVFLPDRCVGSLVILSHKQFHNWRNYNTRLMT